MSEPRKCGRGSVQTKRRSTGLKARTVPSAQPQKIISSERDRQRAAPVYKTGQSRRIGSFQILPEERRQPSCVSAWNDKGHRRLQCSRHASLLECLQTHPVLVLVPDANPSLILWQKAATQPIHLRLHSCALTVHTNNTGALSVVRTTPRLTRDKRTQTGQTPSRHFFSSDTHSPEGPPICPASSCC